MATTTCPSDAEIVEAMMLRGGAFAQHIAGSWYAADSRNRDRLKAAFPDLWERYRDHAKRLGNRS